MAFEHGPYVLGAVLCHGVTHDEGGKPNVIGIVDRLTMRVEGKPPDVMPPQRLRMTLLVRLCCGEARGTALLAVRREDPSGLREPVESFDVLLEGPEKTISHAFIIDQTFGGPGLYWFDITIDGGLLTRVPFRLFYQRAQKATTAMGPR